MKKFSQFLVVLMCALLFSTSFSPLEVKAVDGTYSIHSPEELIYTSEVNEPVRRQLFNDNWKFILGDQSNAQLNTYDDSAWESIQLPHDYSLTQAYTQAGEAESGYKLGGLGWYRKSFTLNSSLESKRVVIEFGGVYNNATVYINGHELGIQPYGYTPFAYDITDYVNFGAENILAVKVNHQFPSSRWYSGSGIYRNVHLSITDKVYVDHYGVTITGNTGELNVRTQVKNDKSDTQSVVIRQQIRNKNQEEILNTVSSDVVTLEPNTSQTVSLDLTINNPNLWSLTNPHLYEVVTSVLVDDVVVDEVINDYGIRTITNDPNEGFLLNGEHIKLQGVSMHHDQGSLGAQAHYRAMERQVEILKEMGANAIRVTHNPAADELIEIANEKGMLIIDEAFDTWIDAKNGNRFDNSVNFNQVVGDNPILGATPTMTWAEFDTKAMVHRGKNAPSVIAWSTGNEVMEGNWGQYDAVYPGVLSNLINWIKEVDPTRPATIGDNKFKARWSVSNVLGNLLTQNGGTVGLNYSSGADFDYFHATFPEWKLLASETASAITSRGIYNPANYDRLLTSYDESAVGWGMYAHNSWYTVITRDFVQGEFVWTGFDYLGEPTPSNGTGSGAVGTWPSPKSSYFGIIDTAGLPKDNFYFYQSQWNDEVNTLHILPAWKQDMVRISNGNVRVDVYSDARTVELFFVDTNGTETSLGSKTFTPKTTGVGHTYQLYEGPGANSNPARNLFLTWSVPYADGEIYAKAYDENGVQITDTQGRSSVKTFGEATSLSATADRTTIKADGYDLSYITIDVLDANGDLVADAQNLVRASVSGNGKLLAMDNGHQVDHEPYDSGKRKALSGKLIAIVQSTKNAGDFTLNLTSEGLSPTSVTVTTTPVDSSSTEKTIVGYTMPRNYYVLVRHQPELVETTTIHFSDGTTEVAPIVWQTQDYTAAGSYLAKGQVEAYNLSVTANVTILESVAALLNYSVAVPLNSSAVALPTSRPAILEDGTILDVEIPVVWEAQDTQNYTVVGETIVNGTAQLFGQTYNVVASVRTAESALSYGSNVAPSRLTLTQSIPENLQSDNLLAIVDGDVNFQAVASGPNHSVWSNYDAAQAGINESEIIFTWATAQNIGKAILYFYQDNWSARLPHSVKLYWSLTGDENAVWQELSPTVTQGTTTTGVPNYTPYTYEFSGVSAVGFKLVIQSSPEEVRAGVKTAVGLTEVQFLPVTTSFTPYDSSELDSLTINGQPANESQLANKVLYTEAMIADVEVNTNKNVAYTILKAHDGVVRILTESEDHSSRSVYEIKLGTPAPLGAENDSLDYPYEKTTATAGSSQNGEGPANAVDNNVTTLWHTAWAGTSMDNFWVTLELQEETELQALRYFSRDSQTNGIVENYKVEVSLDNETWTTVSTGTWTSQFRNWSIAQFDEPTMAKYVRLTGLSTYGDGAQANMFMSASEIRLRMTQEKTSLETALITFDQESYTYTGEQIQPNIVVTLGEATLRKDIDYVIESYENNIEAGTATITIRGISNYSGLVSAQFEIIKEVVYTSLQTLVDEVLTLDTTPYTQQSVLDLQTQLDKAQALLSNPEATQEEVDAQVIALQNALDNLVLETNLETQVLTDLITTANNIDLTLYTQVSADALTQQINTAQELLQNPETTQEEIDAQVIALQNAIDNLVLKLVTTKLDELLAQAQEIDLTIYTQVTADILTQEINASQALLENPEATQTEIDAQVIALQNAIDQLEMKATLSSIQLVGPRKVDYVANETLDLSGSSLTLVYSNGHQETIPVTLDMVSGINFSGDVYGKQVATVTYEGFTANFDVYYNRFKDVPHTNWAYDLIMQSAQLGIVKGYEDGTFGPNKNLTRAETVVMLVRSLGVEVPTNQKSVFTDLPDDNWATDYIMYAVGRGIVNGFEDGTFGSNQLVTRAQLAKMVTQTYNIEINSSNLVSFSDIPETHWAYEFIQALASNNIVGGYEDGTYGPNKNATRAEFTKFIINALNQ